MAGQHSDQVAALARAQADRVQRARRRGVQRHPDLVLDRRQAAGERGAGLVVVVVPGMPVHLRHTAHATEAADDDARTGRGPAEVQYERNPARKGHHRIIFCGRARSRKEKSVDMCIRCAQRLSELETDDYHPTEVLIMVENKHAGTGHA